MPRCIAINTTSSKRRCKRHVPEEDCMCNQHTTKNKNLPECPCCLSVILSCPRRVDLPCGHALHFNCASRWVDKQPSEIKTCPMCRAPIDKSTTEYLDVHKGLREIDALSRNPPTIGGVKWSIPTQCTLNDLASGAKNAHTMLLKQIEDEPMRISMDMVAWKVTADDWFPEEPTTVGSVVVSICDLHKKARFLRLEKSSNVDICLALEALRHVIRTLQRLMLVVYNGGTTTCEVSLRVLIGKQRKAFDGLWTSLPSELLKRSEQQEAVLINYSEYSMPIYSPSNNVMWLLKLNSNPLIVLPALVEYAERLEKARVAEVLRIQSFFNENDKKLLVLRRLVYNV
jgi:hypothetical protein